MILKIRERNQAIMGLNNRIKRIEKHLIVEDNEIIVTIPDFEDTKYVIEYRNGIGTRYTIEEHNTKLERDRKASVKTIQIGDSEYD